MKMCVYIYIYIYYFYIFPSKMKTKIKQKIIKFNPKFYENGLEIFFSFLFYLFLFF